MCKNHNVFKFEIIQYSFPFVLEANGCRSFWCFHQFSEMQEEGLTNLESRKHYKYCLTLMPVQMESPGGGSVFMKVEPDNSGI